MSYIRDDDPELSGAIEEVAMEAEVGELYSRAPWSAWHAAGRRACVDRGLPSRLSGMVASRARLLWLSRIQQTKDQLAQVD